MYTIAKTKLSNVRISLHNFGDIGSAIFQIAKSVMAYTEGRDVMWHIRMGHFEFRVTLEY